EIEKKVNSHLRDQHKVNQEVKIDVHDVEELNSTHSALHYKCQGGEKEHHDKITTSLKDSCKHDDVKKTLDKHVQKDQKPKDHDEKTAPATGEKPKDDHKHEPHQDDKKTTTKDKTVTKEKDVKKTVEINHESHHIVAKDDKTLEGTLIVKNCDHKSLKDDKKSVGDEIEKKVNSHLRDQHKVNQE
ncbi:unnamed protein product, partial [Didymodactylos carnosus]